MDTISRKSLIYKSGVADNLYALNHVLGCAHGCRYPCYAFTMSQRYGRVRHYGEWCRPKLVGNALELLDKEIPRLAKRRAARVHLSLTTDPFMHGFPEIAGMSLQIIARLNAAGIACTVLTKGILPAALADRSVYSRKNEYGISLVSLSETFRQRWEPGAAPYRSRIKALRILHDAGFPTYVHMEPYPTPNLVRQDLGTLLSAVDFVKRIYFSGWNYNAVIRSYSGHAEFYRDQAKIVRAFCRQRGIACEVDR